MLKKDQLKIGEKYHIQVELTARSGYLARVLVTDGAHTAESLTIRTKALLPIPAKPKNDPNRRFRKGDLVRIVEWNGRVFNKAPEPFKLGGLYLVDEDENRDFWYVMLRVENVAYAHPSCFIELVIPADGKLEYIVVDAHTHWDVVDKDLRTVVSYSKGLHPDAKAAAQAESARLNAEYRKEELR